MLDALITSKTRIKLLLKFFLNPETKGYLRGLEQEFEEGSNAIRVELNRFEDAGLLSASTSGNKKFFQANKSHPMFRDLNSLIKKYIGIDKIIEWLVDQSGDIEAVYLAGKLARGLDSNLVDLIVVGDDINEQFVQTMSTKAEGLLNKKVRWVPYNATQFLENRNEFDQLLLLWEREPL